MESLASFKLPNPGVELFLKNEIMGNCPEAAAEMAGAALERLKSHPNDQTALRFLRENSIHWVQKDATGALAWANSLSNEPMKNEALRRIGLGLTATNIPQAIEVADRLPSLQMRQDIYRNAGGSMVDKDPRAAFSWAANISSPILKAATERETLNFAMEYKKTEAFAALTCTENATAWLPILMSGLEDRMKSRDPNSWKWKLATSEIAQVREAVARTYAPENRAPFEETLTRYEDSVREKK